MNQGPPMTKLAREQRGVAVFGGHDRAVALKRLEVVRKRHGDQRASARIGGVYHREAPQTGERDDARVLDAPQLFRVLLWGSRERRLCIDVPVAYAIAAARSGQVRDPAAVLDADQQQGLSGRQSRGTWIEDRVCGVWPTCRGQQGIVGVPLKQVRGRVSQVRSLNGRGLSSRRNFLHACGSSIARRDLVLCVRLAARQPRAASL
jgi:hypothetical protein